MSSDLEIYKQNRINNNNSIFYSKALSLYLMLNKNINTIVYSRQNNILKQRQINFLINQYNFNINNLKKNLEISNLSIKNFLPKEIIINKNKYALLVGINYIGTSNELFGCINDANAIKERLINNNFNNITTLTDLTEVKATKSNILSELKKMLINSKEGDLLFFLFSGHGSYTNDKNGDEKDGYDEMIVSCDSQAIVDDELKSLIQSYLKPNVTLVGIFDSCFSGSVLDLKYQYMDSLNYEKFTENSKDLETQGNVIMISGCTDEQTSADSTFNNKQNGALTWSLLESLKNIQTCSWRELVKSMRNKLKSSEFSQIPQLSSGTFIDIDKNIFI
jgi:hypothetical protein